MKKITLLVFLFTSFAINVTLAQSRLMWSSVSNQANSQITDSRSFASDNAGNTYSVNFTQSALSFYVTYIFYAHDENGIKLWEYVNDSCFTDCNDKYFNIVPIENNGAIFIGEFDDITGTQVRIKRIDRSGTLLWQQYWISPFLSAQPVKSMLDNNGDLVVGFSATVDITDQEDFAIAKFDTSSGFLDWHFELPDGGSVSNSLSEILTSLTIDASNNIYGVGTATNSSAGIFKNYFFKVDETGNLDYRMESSYSGINSNNLSLQLDNAGNLYTLGFTGSQPVIEKRESSSGNLIWSEEVTKDTAVLSNVGFSIVGSSIYAVNNYTYFNPDTSFAGGYWDNAHYMVTKLDANGDFQWQKDYFTNADSLATQDGYGGAVQFSVCDDILYILSLQHLDTLNNILFLHSADTIGNTIWYDTASVNTAAGVFDFDDRCEIYLSRTFDNYNLTQKYTTAPLSRVAALNSDNIFEVYPNPASDEFSIQFKDGKIKSGYVLIYNSLGELLKRQSVSGNNNKISISDIASGLYFVQLISEGNGKFTKVLLKN